MKVYSPRFQVLLIKTVNRKTVDGTTPTSQRFQGAKGVINLAPWLGDGSAINTSKGTRDKAGGFSIVIPDMPIDRHGLDTLYGVVEPMDLIEIRMQRTRGKFTENQPPIVMRGFVSRVTRSESLAGGKPARTVTIQGQDYGKIWQMIQLFYGPSYITGEDILSGFKLMDKFGAGFKNALTNKTFLGVAINDIVNPFLAALLPEGSGFPQITIQTDQVVEASMGITGIQSAEGSVAQLLHSYMDVGLLHLPAEPRAGP
jgi:hypothetical protein